MHNLFLMNEMINYFEHKWTENVICPHCGEEQGKSFIFKTTTPHIDSECKNCEKDFRVWEEIDYSFSTERL